MLIIPILALLNGIINNDAFRQIRYEERQETWTKLLQKLQIYSGRTDPVTNLRRTLVLGASEWLSGMHGSKENEMLKFGYSSMQWEIIWSTMFENGVWNVPGFRDGEGNLLKENLGPEMLIRYAAHEIKCHIVVIDLQLSRIQFCSGNFLGDNNVIFESPLILYATGNPFQSVFQIDHEYWIRFAKEQDEEINQVVCEEKSNMSSRMPQKGVKNQNDIEPEESNLSKTMGEHEPNIRTE